MTTKKSIKYNRMLKAIPTSSTLAEAGRKAGYSESTVKSDIYKDSMQTKIAQDLEAQGFTKDSLLVEFNRIKALCESKEDYALVLRALEGIQKYHLRDNSTQQTAIFNLTPADSDRLRSKLNDSKELEQGEVDKPI